MFKEFRKFILRGNVVDLAVGIAVGAAFTTVVTSLVKGIIDPLISLLYGGTKFANLKYTFNDTDFLYGDVINSAITFLIVAAVIFFFVVQPINKLTDKFASGKETAEDSTKKCSFCLNVIPAKASRCGFCTSKLDTKKA